MYTDICTVKATVHGSFMSVQHPSVQGHYCSNINFYIFVVYDDISYKMTAVTLELAQQSTTPASADKFIHAAKGSIDITNHTTVCNMWEGKGYDTRSYHGYDLKDVKVLSCGS